MPYARLDGNTVVELIAIDEAFYRLAEEENAVAHARLTAEALEAGEDAPAAVAVTDDAVLATMFHPDICARLVPVGQDVQIGWRRDDAGAFHPALAAATVLTPAEAAARARALLAASDWTQVADVQSDMADDKRAAWHSYRASLRAILKSADTGAPTAWPVAPAE